MSSTHHSFLGAPSAAHSVSGLVKQSDLASEIVQCITKYIPASQDNSLDYRALQERVTNRLQRLPVHQIELPDNTCLPECIEWIKLFFANNNSYPVNQYISPDNVNSNNEEYSKFAKTVKMENFTGDVRYEDVQSTIDKSIDKIHRRYFTVQNNFIQKPDQLIFAKIEPEPAVFDHFKGSLSTLISAFLSLPKSVALFSMAGAVLMNEPQAGQPCLTQNVPGHCFLVAWQLTNDIGHIMMNNGGIEVRFTQKSGEAHIPFFHRAMHEISDIIALQIKGDELKNEKLSYCLIHQEKQTMASIWELD
ncbi:hypothetical protein [Endozoicomonas atrinae]|uniref:hypothetical protein n=1 Tax=Endozoicomonas atrinae TaxID=1333660 RepID=UPI003B002927